MYEYYITNTTAIKKYKWDVCIMFGDFGHFEMPRTVSLKLLINCYRHLKNEVKNKTIIFIA